MPIPALDGGRLLFLIIEAVTRKKVNENTERLVHQIGFILLLGLALLITYSDISKIIR
ncbi:site-2 protease family protein [Candidatus Daviesbacteria bacterium]|nr:site-2 protease family protein [Candidatus Daviesbacteria bacterium]